MSQKIHPKVFRLNTIFTWDSKWFAGKRDFVNTLKSDVRMRSFIKTTLKDAHVDNVAIDRNGNKINITITSGKPGFIIGRAGSGIEDLKKKLQKELFRGQRVTLNINIKEVKDTSLSAEIVGQQLAGEIERRLPFRRSMKMAIERIMKAGAKGVKIQISGRLNGAEIARRETISQGSIPLHNLRADVDFARVTARTIWGAIGIKVWIYRGEIFADQVETAGNVEKPEHRNRKNR